MFRARPIQEASAFIVSVTILPSIPLRRQNRTDGQRKILCPSCRSILGHHDMDETEKYLKFSGDMFPEYIELFEDFASGVFAEVAYEE